MTKEKQIEKFIAQSIKKGSEDINEPQLDSIFNEMQTKKIQMFWILYSSSKAFGEATSRIPDYQNKQEEYFKDLSSSYHYHPKQKDNDGEYIVERKDLIQHIKLYLFKHIHEEIKSNIEFKNKPFLEKSPFYFVITALILIPFYIIFSLFPGMQYSKLAILIIYTAYGICILGYGLTRFLIQKTNR